MSERILLKTVVLLFFLAVQHSALGACDSDGYRQFNFWLGQWQVHMPDGELAGANDIRSEYDGCVIHERYSSERGYRGESLNIYDASRDVWHQTWVDNTGLLLPSVSRSFMNSSLLRLIAIALLAILSILVL